MRIPATSSNAVNALSMLSQAQHYFVSQLSQLCVQQQQNAQFTPQQWLRDHGQHGGGIRYEAPQNSLFNQASVNVSQIQYEDNPNKAFLSATALSTIIHPNHPNAPSVHIHVSWTELRSGKSYWRLMADLNPALVCTQDSERFTHCLQGVTGQYFAQGTQQGEQYFYIPALDVHRGVSHFYLEGFNPVQSDGIEFAQTFVTAVIDCYITLLSTKLNNATAVITAEQKQAQLDYHTRYFYQVLTLDKGTTAGLLIHAQNDLGTLGSLPRFINRPLLAQWVAKTVAPRDKLVSALLALLPKHEVCEITSEIKMNIARVLRTHYQSYPLKVQK